MAKNVGMAKYQRDILCSYYKLQLTVANICRVLYSLLRIAPPPCLTHNYMDFVTTLKCLNDTLATISLKRAERSQVVD